MSRTMIGTVVSNKMDKSVVITVGRIKNHPIYKKQYKATARFQAHDEANACQIGDVVEVVETRPISANKRFAVSRIISSLPATTVDRQLGSKSVVKTEPSS